MSPLLYQLSYTATFRKQAVDYITVVQPETNHSVCSGAISLSVSQLTILMSEF